MLSRHDEEKKRIDFEYKKMNCLPKIWQIYTLYITVVKNKLLFQI